MLVVLPSPHLCGICMSAGKLNPYTSFLKLFLFCKFFMYFSYTSGFRKKSLTQKQLQALSLAILSNAKRGEVL